MAVVLSVTIPHPTKAKNMTHPRTGSRKLINLSLLVCVCLVVTVAFRLSRPNATARATIESILLAESSPQQKLKKLASYVKLDDNVSTVHKRISPNPKTELQIDRPTEHAYGLKDSNLVLAIRQDGTVAGIGTHRYGIDDGTIWLAKPEW
ncbi:MAG: hypothetical protein R3C20_02760 [Planctomycetaceae bacterium]